MKKLAIIAGAAALAASPLLADFSYQETSTITGGAIMGMLKVVGVFSKQAREPIVSTISIKGDRMMHKSNTHASIIDLNSQTITTIDFQKKQYSVMTFDEMKQMLEQMQQKMKEKNSDKAEVKFKVSANSTGKTKQASGFDAKELIMKMEMEGTDKESGQKGAMNITSDMWIAQGVPGYQEVRKFHQRMAEKLNWTPGGNMFMQNPQVVEGMAEVYKEMSKLDGVPVEQFITMGGTGQPGEAGAQPQQQQQSQEKPSLGGALGGALGGHFGLGRKKSSSDAPQQQQQQQDSSNAGQGAGTLLEMRTVMDSFNSNPVSDSLFEIPAGFKKVEPDTRRMH